MFCSKCGTMLPDGAKFCSSCGSPVVMPNAVYNAPVIEPAPSNEQVYQSPVIEPVEIPASETASGNASGNAFNTAVNEAVTSEAQPAASNSGSIPVDNQFMASVSENDINNVPSTTAANENVSNDVPFTASVNENVSNEAVFTAPVNENVSNENVFTAPVNENVSNETAFTASVNENISSETAFTTSLNENISNETAFTAPVSENTSSDVPFTASLNENASNEAAFTAFANENASNSVPFTAGVNENASNSIPFTAPMNEYSPVNEAAPSDAQFNGNVNSNINTSQATFNAAQSEPAMSFNNQNGFNGSYTQPQGGTYANSPFINGNQNGNAAPNPQPAYQNPMGAYPDNQQGWGPLMPPKKKSKAPIIIALSVIVLLIAAAVVVCCLMFCGKKDGAGSAEDALIAAFDAFADDDTEDALDAMHPLYNAMSDALDDLGSTYESLGLTSDALVSQLIDSSNPKSGGFKYSNLKITDKETMSKDDVDDYNETIRSTFKQYNVYFNAIGIDIGDIEDYMCEAAVTYEGTVDIDNTEYWFMAGIIKIDGSWYVATISSYEN